MVSKKLQIVNKQGLHMRPAQKFAAEMGPFNCTVYVQSGKGQADGKSMMELMAMGLRQGDEITVVCEGVEEKQALERAVALVAGGLGE